MELKVRDVWNTLIFSFIVVGVATPITAPWFTSQRPSTGLRFQDLVIICDPRALTQKVHYPKLFAFKYNYLLNSLTAITA